VASPRAQGAAGGRIGNDTIGTQIRSRQVLHRGLYGDAGLNGADHRRHILVAGPARWREFSAATEQGRPSLGLIRERPPRNRRGRILPTVHAAAVRRDRRAKPLLDLHRHPRHRFRFRDQLRRPQPKLDMTPSASARISINKAVYAAPRRTSISGRAPDPDGGFSWEEDRSGDALTRAL